VKVEEEPSGRSRPEVEGRARAEGIEPTELTESLVSA
jgi:hypothetical protein